MLLASLIATSLQSSEVMSISSSYTIANSLMSAVDIHGEHTYLGSSPTAFVSRFAMLQAPPLSAEESNRPEGPLFI
jgi:hypothetical protein